MLELGPVVASLPDILRLVAVPAFMLAAYQDLRTRRVSNRLWPPLVAVAVVALLLEAWMAYEDGGAVWREFILVTGLSIGLLIPLAYGFWYFGGFGGADAKAIMVLAVLFPTIPHYEFANWIIPASEFAAGVFSLSILTNAVLLGLLYPLTLLSINIWGRTFDRRMFLGRKISVTQTVELPGRLLETPAGVERGLDLDALRMYLRWRDSDLDALLADPDHHRSTVPTDPEDPGDGAIPDGGANEDPWAAEAFLKDTQHGAYGTTPEMLRASLELLVEREQVWYTPGIPFILLMFGGILVALTYGDILGTIMTMLGLV